MNPKKWEKAKTKLLLFFILGILGISISFLFSGCGTGPLTKALLFNIGAFAVDFSAAPSDLDTPTDFPEVGFLSLGRGTDRLNQLTETGFTIEGWVKSTTSTAGSAFKGGILSRAHDNYGCVLYVSADPKFSVKPRATTVGGVYTVSSGVVQYNSTGWTHVAGVYANEDHSAVHAACTGNIAGGISVAIDSNDNVHISYSQGGPMKDLKYATNASGSWETARLSTLGGNPNSIAIDSNNDVHISFYDNTSSIALDLRYATCASGSNCTQNSSPPPGWSDILVDGYGKTGSPLSLAIGSNNRLYVAYYLTELIDCVGVAQSSDNLRYATCDAGTSDCTVQANWTTMTVDSSGVVGNYPSIAVDSSGNLHISYYRETSSYLKYATCTPTSGNGYCTTGGWSTAQVENSADVGLRTSIATDSSNNVYISYYDTTNDNLKYATNASGSWANVAVDSTGDVGSWSSIAIDSVAAGENVHISYYDATNGNLKYATCDPGAGNSYCIASGWTSGNVDTAGDVGARVSIAIDSSDDLHIAYRYATDGNLKYATCSGSCTTTANWGTPVTVDDGDARGETPHLDIYVNGEFQACAPAISIGPSEETRPTCDGGTVVMSYESNEQIGRSQIGWTSGINASTRLEGIIDEVRFWRVARTQSQIQQCMSRYLGVDAGDCSIGSDANGDKVPDLGGYWMLNEGSGTGINDASGAGSSGSKNYCDSDDGNGDGDVTDDPGDVNCAGPTANSILWKGGWTSDTPF